MRIEVIDRDTVEVVTWWGLVRTEYRALFQVTNNASPELDHMQWGASDGEVLTSNCARFVDRLVEECTGEKPGGGASRKGPAMPRADDPPIHARSSAFMYADGTTEMDLLRKRRGNHKGGVA